MRGLDIIKLTADTGPCLFCQDEIILGQCNFWSWKIQFMGCHKSYAVPKGLASCKLGSNAKPSLPRTWSTQGEVALEPNLSFPMGRSWYGLSNKDERLGKSSKKSTPRWLLCETCLVRRGRGKYPPSVILGNRWRCNYMEREYPSPKDDWSDNMYLAYLYTF